MFLDDGNTPLQVGVQRNALSTQHKLMEILAMLDSNLKSGANVLRDEGIVEHCDRRQCRRPSAVLEDVVRAAGTLDDYVRRMGSTKSATLLNERRLTTGERAQDGRECGLASTILGIDDRHACKRELGAWSDRVELPNVAKEIKSFNHHAAHDYIKADHPYARKTHIWAFLRDSKGNVAIANWKW